MAQSSKQEDAGNFVKKKNVQKVNGENSGTKDCNSKAHLSRP